MDAMAVVKYHLELRNHTMNHLNNQKQYGDVWAWVAIDPESKLVISWCVGTRGASTARELAMAAGINDHVWDVSDIAAFLDSK
jgi:IS1 family transposase